MTEPDTRPLICVVTGIIPSRHGDYPLSLHPEGRPYAGYWELAGGKVEANEAEFQVLQREFEEEFGIHIHHAAP